MTIRLELLAEGIRVAFEDETGATITKIVDPDDLAIALAKQTKLDTGLLPRNTRYYTKSDIGDILVLEVPAHVRDIHYIGGQRFRVPMPATLHILALRNVDETGITKQLINSWLYCLKTPLTDMSSQLFRFPFGNVYSGGGVCWGSVHKPTYPELAMFSAVPDLLLSSTFNGDLSSGAFLSFRDEENNIDVFRSEHLMSYLNGKELFPVDKLIYEKTFGEAIRSVSGGRS